MFPKKTRTAAKKIKKQKTTLMKKDSFLTIGTVLLFIQIWSTCPKGN